MQFDRGLADEVIKYQSKVADILNSPEALSVREIKTCEDMGPYKDWFIQLVKYTNKLQETVSSDFI